MASFKLYETLGVDKNASAADIKKAYKRAAMTHHPDKGGDPDKFKDIGRAYEILADDQKRSMYDQLGDQGYEAHAQGGGHGPPMDPFGSIFEQMFSGMGMGPGPMNKRGNDHLHTIHITLFEAFTGCKKHLKLSIKRQCPKCKNTCGACQGRGMIQNMIQRGFMTQVISQKCPSCQGLGQSNSGCASCQNQGCSIEDKNIEIDIPKGVNNGHRYVFEGCGESGDPPGNLVVQINVQQSDGIFNRVGQDLTHIVNLTFLESITGKKIKIPHYSGEFDYTIYGIISPSTIDYIPNKGLTDTGKLEIHYRIQYPSRNTREWPAEASEVLSELLTRSCKE